MACQGVDSAKSWARSSRRGGGNVPEVAAARAVKEKHRQSPAEVLRVFGPACVLL